MTPAWPIYGMCIIFAVCQAIGASLQVATLLAAWWAGICVTVALFLGSEPDGLQYEDMD